MLKLTKALALAIFAFAPMVAFASVTDYLRQWWTQIAPEPSATLSRP